VSRLVGTKKRRALLLLLALWLLLVTSGGLVPLVYCVAPLAKAALASEDFPCAHHLCCCQNAEQCRTCCCCFPKKGSSPCSHCSGSQAPDREPGKILRCSCEWPAAFTEGQKPPLERPHQGFTLVDIASSAARPIHCAVSWSPSFLEPLSKVPIES